jgi:hypothetical protein
MQPPDITRVFKGPQNDFRMNSGDNGITRFMSYILFVEGKRCVLHGHPH